MHLVSIWPANAIVTLCNRLQQTVVNEVLIVNTNSDHICGCVLKHIARS